MSYPYVMYNGHKLSIIEPFTIDDKLITNICTDVYYGIAGPDTYYIKMTLNFSEYFLIQTDHFNSWMGDVEMNHFMRQQYMEYSHNENYFIAEKCQWYIDRADDDMLYFRLFMLNVEKQSSYIATDYRMVREHCEQLRLQDRPSDTPMQYCSTLYDTATMNANRCIFADYSYSPSYTYTAIPPEQLRCTILNTMSYGTLYDIKDNNIIHRYNYKPEYKKHYIGNSSLLLGAEIEVDCGGESETHAKEVLKIMNGEESEENIFCVHDGSLKKGLEFPTQPGTLEWHKSLPYEQMFDYLDKNGYKAHDTNTCGLHIHINRDFFGDAEAECIGKLMFIIEKFSNEFSVIGRRDCHYSKMFGYKGEKCKELYDKGIRDKSKYNAINLLHDDTIEIRAFKGTLKYSTFMNTLEFVSDLAYFVKEHSSEAIERMTWKDLYNTFSDDLKQYYDERFAKQVVAEEKKTAERAISFNTLSDLSAIDLTRELDMMPLPSASVFLDCIPIATRDDTVERQEIRNFWRDAFARFRRE